MNIYYVLLYISIAVGRCIYLFPPQKHYHIRNTASFRFYEEYLIEIAETTINDVIIEMKTIYSNLFQTNFIDAMHRKT